MAEMAASLTGRSVLVTGGAGFIGSELVRQLAHLGAEVKIIDNLVNGKTENIRDILGDKVVFHHIDVRDTKVMEKLLSGTEIVYHLACLGVRHSIHNPHENHEVNATATLNLLQKARAVDVQRFVYVSTSEVYGTAQYAPMPEEHPTMPHTVYGGSKLAGECYARAYHDTYDLETVVVRPFNAYGPRCHHEGDSGEVIPKFMLRCMAGQPMIVFGDGSQTRDFTYVADTARAIIMAGVSDKAIGQTINVGRGEELTVLQLAQEVKSALGLDDAQIEFDTKRPGDVWRLLSDSTKARDLLGYKPEIDFHEGLKKLAAWYTDMGVSAEVLLREEVKHNWKGGH